MSVVNVSELDQLSSMWLIETIDTFSVGCQIGPVRACSPSGSHFSSTAANRRGISLKNDVIDTLSRPPVCGCSLSLSFCLSLSGRSLSANIRRQSGISSVFVGWDIFEVLNFLRVYPTTAGGETILGLTSVWWAHIWISLTYGWPQWSKQAACAI